MPTGAPANFCQLLIAGDSSRTSRRYASTGDADRCTVKHMQSPHPPIGGTGHPSLRPLWLQVPAAWRGWAPGAGRLGWASLSPHLFVSKLPLSPPSHPPPAPWPRADLALLTRGAAGGEREGGGGFKQHSLRRQAGGLCWPGLAKASVRLDLNSGGSPPAFSGALPHK